jgi:hypothetical protein
MSGFALARDAWPLSAPQRFAPLRNATQRLNAQQ